MPDIRIIPKEGFKTTSWSGGTTTELFIWPEGASYAERRFSVRISTASVDIDESVFTPLPGVKRFLTLLCQGFELNVNGEEKRLPYGEVLEFSGEDAVTCRGRGRDLNLMLKGAEGSMRIVTGAFTVEPDARAFVYAAEGGPIAYCGRCSSCTSTLLMRHDFAELAPGGYMTRAKLALFIIEN